MSQLEGSILQSRRLEPKDNVREEGGPYSCLPPKSPSQSSKCIAKTSPTTNYIRNQTLTSTMDKPKQHQPTFNTNSGSKPPRIAFDSKPFYKQMKPLISQNKKIRYMHLESTTTKKGLPKDDLGIPQIYPTTSTTSTTTTNCCSPKPPTTNAVKAKELREKTPLRLNPIFSTDCWET